MSQSADAFMPINPRDHRPKGGPRASRAWRKHCGAALAVACLASLPGLAAAQTGPRPLRSDIQVTKLLDTTQTGSPAVRLAKDPRNSAIYYLKLSGDVFIIRGQAGTSTRLYTTADHGLTDVQGFAIGPDGTMYLVGNEEYQETRTRGRIAKGVPQADGSRIWTQLAVTAPYPKSLTAYDHNFNGIVVNPAGTHIYVNSGSRTDHGEEQNTGGLFPGVRESGLTALILRLPTSGNGIFLRNNRQWLRDNGYIFAEGIRNTFDMRFAPNGDLFGTENGPGRDNSEELNWLRQGRHYGFPWRIGGTDNPMRFRNYDPTIDRLLNPLFDAVRRGFYYNDPAFPPLPGVPLIEPIRNLGPDADKYRDPVDGIVKDGSDEGVPVGSFTAHRSPLGLVFDTTGGLIPEFRGDAFMLSWTTGDPTGDTVNGPFKDPGEDLMHLDLTKTGQTYSMRATKIVEGFRRPIDAEIIGNRIYVLEYAGNQSIWVVTLPRS